MTGLKSLNLRSNHLKPEGGKALAPALQALTGLKSLNLSGNYMGPEGAKALAPALQAMTGLKSLDLTANDLGPEGGKALAPALQAMTGLSGIKDQLPTSKYVRTHRTAGSSRCWSGSDSGVGLYVRVEHVRTGLPRATTMCRLEGSSD